MTTQRQFISFSVLCIFFFFFFSFLPGTCFWICQCLRRIEIPQLVQGLSRKEFFKENLVTMASESSLKTTLLPHIFTARYDEIFISVKQDYNKFIPIKLRK